MIVAFENAILMRGARLAWAWVASLFLLLATAAAAEPTRIVVHADQPGTRISRYLTGACIEDVNHEIYGGIYSQMLFGESFQEPATTAAPIGFQGFGGRWSVKEGVLTGVGPDGPKLVNFPTDGPVTEVRVEILLPDAGHGNGGLLVRVANPGVGADNFDGYEIALDAGHQYVRLGWHGHKWRPIADVPHPIPIGTWIPLSVRLLDTALEVFVDGKLVMRHDNLNPLPGGTGIGLRSWVKEVRYRNLTVAQPGRETTALPFIKSGNEEQEVSHMWRPVERGSAEGRMRLDDDRPFVGGQSQEISFAGGSGEVGIANRGLNGWGLAFEAGKPYEGYAWLRASNPAQAAQAAAANAADAWVALESGDGKQTLAEGRLGAAKGDWSRFDFTLTPSDTIRGGRFVIKLKQPGSVAVGHAFLQPGAWGRYKNLPVRRDVAEGLVDQGITVLRYGGSMVNHPEYRWKEMIGPRDRRPPYRGTWYPYSSNGWGIVDFVAFCEAAGFRAIPDFNMDETPQDMADFVDYMNAPADSPWGQRRA
ncbi:MAG TPA: family 16 glycoside hydrolase, partial [Pirellulales bacterium]|nr:family 16 glycoside hydrolase [Pirellulales bacterium]